MDRAKFEAVVHEAVASIPEVLRAQLVNVDVVVEAWPSGDDLRMADVQEGCTLFGLYTGVPLTERTSDYNMILLVNLNSCKLKFVIPSSTRWLTFLGCPMQISCDLG